MVNNAKITDFNDISAALANASVIHGDNEDEKLTNIASALEYGNTVEFSQITPFELSGKLQSTKGSTTAGIFSTNPRILKEYSDIVVAPLCNIFNTAFATGVFPDAWKLAVVPPITKAK